MKNITLNLLKGALDLVPVRNAHLSFDLRTHSMMRSTPMRLCVLNGPASTDESRNGLRIARFSLVAIALVGAAEPANAQGAASVDTAGLTKLLFGLFVVATMLESALATIFNWRLYREFFDNRATKTLVMIAAGCAVVWAFQYDVFDQVIVAAGGVSPSDKTGSRLLSALTLAGGSAAVYQLFKALGLRQPAEPLEAKPKPAENRAWVSVRVVRRRMTGPVRISIEPIPEPTTEKLPVLAGELGASSFGQRLISVFLADTMRLPSYGGREVEVGKYYEIKALTKNPDDAAKELEWPVYKGGFANRAVVDLTVTI